MNAQRSMNSLLHRLDHQQQRRRLMLVALNVLALAANLPAVAQSLPAADKMIALVRADGCELDKLKPRVNAAGAKLVHNKATTRVEVDWPANPDKNVDLLGRPSPYIAALEATAPSSALRGITKDLERALGKECRVDIYSVHERRLAAPSRTWPLGQPSPGVKSLMTLVRKDGLSLEQFNAEWEGPHAAMAMSNRPEGDRYIQNLVLARSNDDTPALDGIGEAGGPGGATPNSELTKEAQTAAAAARLKSMEHAKTFLNMGKLQMFSAQETILKD